MKISRNPELNPIKQKAKWFDLRNYDSLANATVETWFNQLAIRIDLRNIRKMFRPVTSETQMQREAYDMIMRKLCQQGVLGPNDLKIIVELEPYLYPGTFSTFHSASTPSDYVRSMTVRDYMHISRSMMQDSQMKAEVALQEAGLDHAGPFSLPCHRETILSDALIQHLNLSSRELNKEFIVVDLRLPRPLLLEQIEGIIAKRVSELTLKGGENQKSLFMRKVLLKEDGKKNSSSAFWEIFGLVIPSNQKVSPKCQSWVKSRVLPYLDIQYWLDDLGDQRLKESITDSHFAMALNVDLEVIRKTTREHAEALSDQYSIEFVNLIESVHSARRGPVSKLRKA